ERVPVPISFQIGATLLPPRLLRSLRIGDVVLIQDLFAPSALYKPFPTVLRMVLARRLTTRVSRVDGGWRVEGGQQQGEREADCPVDEQYSENNTPVLRDLDELQISLVFEVARMTLPLGELRRLDSGSLLEVDVTPGTVRILASGQPIGAGE